MGWFIAVLIVGFLVFAAGRETRFGGLGLLWRAAVVIAVVGILLIGGVLIYLTHQDRQVAKTKSLDQIFSNNNKVVFKPETDLERRRRLGLPIPFETVLSFPFPSTTSQKASEDGSWSGTVGWEMRVAELPAVTPSTRKTPFFLGIERVVVSLNNGAMKLICTNTNPTYQKTLSGCRPVLWTDKDLGHVTDGMPYESQEEWDGQDFGVGTKVEMYTLLSCTDELLKSKEPCDL